MQYVDAWRKFLSQDGLLLTENRENRPFDLSNETAVKRLQYSLALYA